MRAEDVGFVGGGARTAARAGGGGGRGGEERGERAGEGEGGGAGGGDGFVFLRAREGVEVRVAFGEVG